MPIVEPVLIFRLPPSISLIILVILLFEPVLLPIPLPQMDKSIVLPLMVSLVEPLVKRAVALLRRVDLIICSLTLVLIVILAPRRLEVVLSLRVLLILVVILRETAVARGAGIGVAAFTRVNRPLD